MSTLDAIERQHILVLRRISEVITGIFERGLANLLLVWPTEKQDALPHPGVSVYPTALSGGRKVVDLSDRTLTRLWPNLRPVDVRIWAPWAYSHDEVRRIANVPQASPAQLELLVKESIRLEKQAHPRLNPPIAYAQSTRSPHAFQLRYPSAALGIFDAGGRPIGPPPLPAGVTVTDIERQMGWCRVALEAHVNSSTIEPVVSKTVDGIERVTATDLRRVISIDIREIPAIAKEREHWYEQHVNLITKMSDQTRQDVHEVVSHAHQAGLRVEMLAGLLKERFEVSKSRAELIARDQVLKANGRIMRTRQEEVGIREYIWITSRDKRVREAHVKLHNTKQKWAAPPPVGHGRHEHPGQDYQCRCIAKPVAPAWLTA